MGRAALVLLLVFGLPALDRCSPGNSDPSMDIGGNWGNDIPAKEIKEFTPVEKNYCVGRKVDPKFAEYDYQCEAARGKGECVQMPNPGSGKSFYCALCGLKGSKMICYMINPED